MNIKYKKEGQTPLQVGSMPIYHVFALNRNGLYTSLLLIWKATDYIQPANVWRMEARAIKGSWGTSAPLYRLMPIHDHEYSIVDS